MPTGSPVDARRTQPLRTGSGVTDAATNGLRAVRARRKCGGAPHWGAPRGTAWSGGRALLELDGRAGLLELGLELVGLLALDALLDGLGGLVDEGLGLLQAQAGRRADDLDDLDLLVAGAGEHDVDGGRLLLGRGAVARGGA